MKASRGVALFYSRQASRLALNNAALRRLPGALARTADGMLFEAGRLP